jgi:hypothetical protein
MFVEERSRAEEDSKTDAYGARMKLRKSFIVGLEIVVLRSLQVSKGIKDDSSID